MILASVCEKAKNRRIYPQLIALLSEFGIFAR